MLSVLDSDKRLADHFGGKVRLVLYVAVSHVLITRCTWVTTSFVNFSANSQMNVWQHVKVHPHQDHQDMATTLIPMGPMVPTEPDRHDPKHRLPHLLVQRR